jgi:hypothetical protein
MSLLKQITKPVREMFADQGSGHAAEDSTKRKFVVTLKGGPDGSEIEKNVKAYSITDIKAHFGTKFISAELHPDEAGTRSDFTHPDDEDDDRTADEVDADDTDLDEAMTTPDGRKKKDFDFKRLMAGAMSRDEYNKKWKVGKYAEPKSKLAGPGGVYQNLLVKLGEAASECKPPAGLDAEERYAYRKGWQNPDDTPEDWEFKSNSKQGKAFMRGRMDCRSLDESKEGPGFYIVGGRPGEWEVVDGPFADKEKAAPALRKHNGSGEDFTARFFKQRPRKITEMAKRTTPAEFYKLAIAKHGIKNAGHMSWEMIKAVADGADILIPAYIRDNKIGRGVWDAKPKDMKAAAHEPSIAKTDEPKAEPKPPSKDAFDRTVSRMAADAMTKSTPVKKEEPKGAPVPEKKDHYEKHDFPDVEFAWTTSYSEPRELYAAIKQHHSVEHTDTQRVQVGKSSTGRFGIVLATYYILKKGTQDVLGRWTVTGGDKIPGRGMVAYGEGNIALSKKAQKNRDDNMYGFLIKPQHGSPFVSVGTQNSHGPWDKFSAEANVRDKYEHYAYDDEFGHGTISVVKVVKKNGKWERA